MKGLLRGIPICAFQKYPYVAGSADQDVRVCSTTVIAIMRQGHLVRKQPHE